MDIGCWFLGLVATIEALVIYHGLRLGEPQPEPAAVETPAPPPAPAPEPESVEPTPRVRPARVTVKLMDRDERMVRKVVQITPDQRRPHLILDGRKYCCAREVDGAFIYREVAF